MSTEEPGYIDPADQWVLDPVTGMYELRLDVPPQRQEQGREQQAEPAPDAYGQGEAQDSHGAHASYDPYGSYDGHDGPRAPGGRDAQDAAGEQDPYDTGGQDAYVPFQAHGERRPPQDPYDTGEQPAQGDPYGTGEHDAYSTGEHDAYGTGEHDPYGTGRQDPQGGHDGPSAPSAPTWAPTVPPAPRTAPAGGGRRAGGQGAGSRRKAKPPRGKGAAALGRLPGGPVVWGAGAACAVLLVGVVVGVAATGGGGGTALRTVDLAGAGSREPVHTGAMNVLLLDAHPAAGASTDSAVLVHLSADRGSITALAIPPALVTDIPDCPAATGGGTVQGAKSRPFSDALAGGRDAGCALRTVKQLTGLAVDHVVAVDYASVKGGTKDIAAADRCVDRTITVPRTLTALARTAPSAVTADTPLGTPETMSNLAAALGAIDPKNTTFVALPLTGGGASATPDKDKASQIYAMLANDVPLSGARSAADDAKLTGTRAKPHDTRVEIYNGTGVFGASQDVLAWLQNTQGVDRSTNGGDAHGKVAKTTLQYAPNQADQARSLAAMMGLPGSALVQGTKDAAPRANMTLTLGADYTKPGVPIGPPTAPPEDVKLTPGTAAHC